MPDKPDQIHAWFLRGEHDLKSAKILLSEGGYLDTVAFLVQQAVEKYLKGFLLNTGWKLVKTRDLEVLIAEAVTHNQDFEQYLDFARIVSGFYIESRYPPGTLDEYSKEEMVNIIEEAEKLIDMIKNETNI